MNQNGLLETIDKVFKKSIECELKESFFERYDSDLNHLSEYFNLSKIQSFLVATVFKLNIKNGAASFFDLADYFNCNRGKIFRLRDEFEELRLKKILSVLKSEDGIPIGNVCDFYTLNVNISKAILNNESFLSLEQSRFNSIIELLEYLNSILNESFFIGKTTFELFRITEEIINSNLDLKLIKKITDLKLKTPESLLYLYLIWKIILGVKSVTATDTLYKIYDTYRSRSLYMLGILKSENALMEANLIGLVDNSSLDKIEIELSDYSLGILSINDIIPSTNN